MRKTPPKEYILPNHPIAAANYVPARTTDALEADRRRGVRGKNSVIMDEQATGLQVLQLALENVRLNDGEVELARLAGGAALLSAKYVFDNSNDEVGYRVVKLPVIKNDDGERFSEQSFEDSMLEQLASNTSKSYELATSLGNDTATDKQRKALGRSLMQLGVNLALHPLNDFCYTAEENPVSVQTRVKHSVTAMHDGAIQLAQEIGTVPSLAQFADQVSPLGVHLMTDRRYPITLVRSFRQAQEQVSDEQGVR